MGTSVLKVAVWQYFSSSLRNHINTRGIKKKKRLTPFSWYSLNSIDFMYKEGQSRDGARATWKKEKEDGEVCNERMEWQQISESGSKIHILQVRSCFHMPPCSSCWPHFYLWIPLRISYINYDETERSHPLKY